MINRLCCCWHLSVCLLVGKITQKVMNVSVRFGERKGKRESERAKEGPRCRQS